jgi:phosphoribosylformylglycinamidine synthase
MKEVVKRAKEGVPTVGICNGFQVLCESGLLPGVLMRNANLKYICRDVHIKVETSQSLFTGGYEQGQVLRIPIAHNEGNFVTDEDTLARIEDRGEVAFRYCTDGGEVNETGNPNGAMHNIAGVFNETKTVLGLMPHPERLADPQLGGTDGRAMFDHLVEALA